MPSPFACALATVTTLLAAAAVSAASDSDLRFLREGALVKTVDRPALERACPVETVRIDDPYYGAEKSFRAFPLRCVLALGLGPLGATFDREQVFLRARDGYVKSAAGARLAEDGGYLAFADARRTPEGGEPRWDPIDRRQVDPGPYYLVWTKPQQRDGHGYPWPYQLAAIEIASFDTQYPHTLPRTAAPGSAAWVGFAVFRDDCVSCHAVNGEGGTIGPELNVPQSIVEYRPAEQIKAYVRDPATFRYGNMPAHPDLSDQQLDGLIAYFTTMKGLKHDPRRTR
jgi:mono/diheme cytochrome c family protein